MLLKEIVIIFYCTRLINYYLPTTNYIYESDLRIYYLETKNTELELQIVAWQKITDSDTGYNDLQASIVESNT